MRERQTYAPHFRLGATAQAKAMLLRFAIDFKTSTKTPHNKKHPVYAVAGHFIFSNDYMSIALFRTRHRSCSVEIRHFRH